MSAGSAGFPAGSAELQLDPLARLRRLSPAPPRSRASSCRSSATTTSTSSRASVQPLLWLFVFGTALQHARSLERRPRRLPRVHRAGRDGAGGALPRDLLRARRDLGTRPRAAAAAARDAAAAARDRARQGERRCDPRDHPGDRLLAVLAIAQIHIHWSVSGRSARSFCSRVGTAAFACMSMLLAAMRQDARAVHGHRPADRDAALLRVERAVPARAACRPGCGAFARVNPLTYEVDGMRQMLLDLDGRRRSGSTSSSRSASARCSPGWRRGCTRARSSRPGHLDRR